MIFDLEASDWRLSKKMTRELLDLLDLRCPCLWGDFRRSRVPYASTRTQIFKVGAQACVKAIDLSVRSSRLLWSQELVLVQVECLGPLKLSDQAAHLELFWGSVEIDYA